MKRYCRFPYFLPCLIISVFSLGVFIICCYLPKSVAKNVPVVFQLSVLHE
ncbi:hypothetical protein Patl1_21022 [Pistacia atlantica]|uniref:Uncharacterized protein n=1 Tax=Pistacia atlantica TaxID=434234 RepID=A0ACC1BHM0_9ROSI|nr:hypothetical protein Patl1_21022 [Pistacia atlantica]